VATTAAPEQIERPAARTRATEPARAQNADQRLRKNRLEEEPSRIGETVPEVDLSFGDFLDLINPLHHIPIIGTIYRAITGDEIGGPAKILGGLLFGGPLGFMASIVDTIVTQATGRDLGETVVAAFIGQDEPPAPQVAAAPDLEETSGRNNAPAQDEAPEDAPPMANNTPSPISGHKDPFGLERSMAGPIEVMPAALPPTALPPVAMADVPERFAVPSTQPPAWTARPLTVATPRSQVATVRRVDLDEMLRVPISQGPDAIPETVAASTPVAAAESLSTDAPRPGIQRLFPSIATSGRGLAEQMIEALDKYQALASERYQVNKRGDRRLDLIL
jgi:hypothetical protein